ncbi:hypothetical protein MKEN_00398900 [Mycena kentingensis (nom. inval.)]|nr:hypothetical protein MKEN_00398900 [Mycena kentingensis (nom. inval.)]
MIIPGSHPSTTHERSTLGCGLALRVVNYLRLDSEDCSNNDDPIPTSTPVPRTFPRTFSVSDSDRSCSAALNVYLSCRGVPKLARNRACMMRKSTHERQLNIRRRDARTWTSFMSVSTRALSGDASLLTRTRSASSLSVDSLLHPLRTRRLVASYLLAEGPTGVVPKIAD